MKLKAIITLGALYVMLGFVYVLNRPLLNTIDAALPQNFPGDGFSHEVFEQLLQTYVDDAGHVDYESWRNASDSMKALNSYLAAVARYSPENSPDRFKSQHASLAYWLYAYNASVIKSILDRWPMESVTDMKAPIEFVKGFGFFYRQRFVFGEKAYSLYAIENDKIRDTYRDARIHFVLNCGSVSCPVLRPELPTGDELEPFLQRAAIDFVGEHRNVHIDHANRQIVLSDIFKWFKKDFINDLRHQGLPSKRGLTDYIASMAPEPLRTEIERSAEYKIVFHEYDWSINEAD